MQNVLQDTKHYVFIHYKNEILFLKPCKSIYYFINRKMLKTLKKATCRMFFY